MTTLKITKKHHKHLNNPFPSTPTSLPLILGTLHFNLLNLSQNQTFPIGNDFQLSCRPKNGSFLSISHRSDPTRAIWSTVPDHAFISAAMADTEVKESRGSFVVKDGDVHLVCNHQMIENIRVVSRDEYHSMIRDHDYSSEYLSFDRKTVEENENNLPMLLIEGKVFKVKRKKKGKNQGVDDLTSAKYWIVFDQKNSDQVGFQVKFARPNLEYKSKTSPRKYGMYNGFSRRLRKIKRSRYGWSVHLSKPKIIFNALEFIEHFTEAIGRPPELPEWIVSGAIVGMQGGTDFVREIWGKLQSYDVPISAFWLQDWVGQRKTVIGSQLWWNWEVDTTRYSGWHQLIKDLRAQHVQVMTYCNPCLSPEASKKGYPVCRHLFLHYPKDDHVLSLTYEQFLVGEEILVVPKLWWKHRLVIPLFLLKKAQWLQKLSSVI